MLDAFFRRLDQEQSDYAKEALTRPRGQSEFDYGYAVGLYAGLQRARDVLENMLRDEDERTRDL